MSSGYSPEQKQQAFVGALAGLKSGDEIALMEGSNLVRLLPRFKSDGQPEMEFWLSFVVHWGVGPNKRLVRCLRPEGQPCYVCEYAKQLAEAGHTDAAQKLQASNRFLIAAVPMNNPDNGPKILACGSQILEGILAIAIQPNWGDPSDTQGGFAVSVNKTGSGLSTKYTVNPDPNKGPIKEEWLQKLPNLANHFRLYSYQELQLVAAGQNPDQVQAAAPPQQIAAPQQVPVQPTTADLGAGAPIQAVPQQVPVQAAQTVAPPPPPVAPVQGTPPPAVGTPVADPTTVVTGGEAPQVAPAPPQQEFQAQPPQQ